MLQGAIQLGDAGIHLAAPYYNGLISVVYKVSVITFGAGIGAALVGFGVNQACPYPWGCKKHPSQIFFDAGAHSDCLKQREVALIDPANPPLDWDDDIQDVCKKEAEIPTPLCDVEIHQTGGCKMAHQGVAALHAGIQKIAELPNEILNRLNLFLNLGQAFTGLHFITNRVLQRFR